jgi:hypothetical protein
MFEVRSVRFLGAFAAAACLACPAVALAAENDDGASVDSAAADFDDANAASAETSLDHAGSDDAGVQDDGSALEASEGGSGLGFLRGGGRLLLTGGVTQVEGAGGGGLSPWALIGGYGSRDEFGANAFFTGVNTDDFSLTSFGGLISVKNRLELSIARQSFNLNALGGALGLGREFSIRQTVVGAKVRLIGDAVLDQDSILPQISVGVQYKKNDEGAIVRSLGARDDDGVDYYASATKIILSQSLLLNATARLTKANQFGILGFGGPGNGYKLQAEGSAALLLTRKLAIGGEYRTKSDNLGLGEEDAFDLFVAYAPTRNASVTLAYVDLGNIVVGSQRGIYASLQIGF